MAKTISKLRLQPRHLILLGICAVALYVVVPQFGDFRTSWQLVRHPEGIFILIAAGLTLLTYGAAAGTYYFLAVKPLRFWRTLVVQLAAMFMNRLLPGGIGALGANYMYLRHESHKSAPSASIVALNNIIGFAGHLLLVIFALLFSSRQALGAIGHPGPLTMNGLKIMSIGLVIFVIAGVIFGWKRLRHVSLEFFQQLSAYRQRPWALAGALLTSCLLTFFNIACLFYCLLGLGIHLPFVTIVLIFSFGVGAGIATPTPGGLGGFEAGLAAGLAAYHVPAASALAAALLYRLVSFWFPLALGAVAFIVCERQGWLAVHSQKQ